MADLMKLSPESILLRWVNYHLERAGVPRRITNFTSDIKVTLSLFLKMFECLKMSFFCFDFLTSFLNLCNFMCSIYSANKN